MKTFLFLALALTSSAAFAASCRDGEVQYFPLNGAGAEGQQEVPVVCKNGMFFAPAAPIRHAACREGQTETWSTGGGEGSAVNTETYVCHNGSFISTAGAPEQSPAYRCHDGQVEYFVVGRGEGEPVQTEVFVCHNGKLHRIK
jgi:hypothetical protein